MPTSHDTARRFVGVSLDCADPDELATFNVSLLGGRLLWGDADSAGVQVPGVLLIMQRVTATGGHAGLASQSCTLI
jgi:hypothetical protein